MVAGCSATQLSVSSLNRVTATICRRFTLVVDGSNDAIGHDRRMHPRAARRIPRRGGIALCVVALIGAAGCSSGASSTASTVTARSSPTTFATLAPVCHRHRGPLEVRSVDIVAARAPRGGDVLGRAATATTTAAGRVVSSPSDNVGLGDTGPGVKQIQTALAAHGFEDQCRRHVRRSDADGDHVVPEGQRAQERRHRRAGDVGPPVGFVHAATTTRSRRARSTTTTTKPKKPTISTTTRPSTTVRATTTTKA